MHAAPVAHARLLRTLTRLRATPGETGAASGPASHAVCSGLTVPSNHGCFFTFFLPGQHGFCADAQAEGASGVVI